MLRGEAWVDERGMCVPIVARQLTVKLEWDCSVGLKVESSDGYSVEEVGPD